MISNFITYLEVEKRFSSHTVKSYYNDLKSFFRFHGIEKPEDIDRNHIRAWIIDLSENGYENRSINRKLSALKSYFKFLMLKGKCDKNPTVGVVAPKVKKRLPEFVPEKDMISLDDLYIKDETHPRTKAIIELFYQTGIRLSELINLKRSDVSSSEIKVLGKRNKERIVPITPQLSIVLNEWLKFSQDNLEALSTDYLFITDKGNKLYPAFVYRLVNKFLSESTTIQHKSPHVLRHTFATHMLNNGAEIESVKELLGHSSLAATQVYTHNSIARLKKAYKSAHPRA